MIIVNDGSTDNTEEVLAPYTKDARIKVINQDNQGISSARKRAFEESWGDYIAVLDADCLMLPKRLEGSLKAIKGYDLVYTGAEVFDKGRKLTLIPDDINKLKSYKDILDRKHPNANQVIPNFTVMGKRKCFMGVYRPEFRVNDDLWTVLQWVKRGYKIKLIPFVSTTHMMTGHSVTDRLYDDTLKITEQIRSENGI